MTTPQLLKPPRVPAPADTRKRARRSVVASMLLGAVVLLSALTNVAPASAAVFNACNGVDNTPGLGGRCTVTVTNNLNLSNGVTSSTTVIVACHGAANTDVACTTTPSSSSQLITSVNQCNNAENGGGASLICAVSVVNNITGDATATTATVNQCVGSADGTGVGLCDPKQSTTSATITQCNGSGNGGGSTVTCTVVPSTNSSALPIRINQCNDSANGGGSIVLCRSSITNNILAAAPPVNAAPITVPGGAPVETVPGGAPVETTPGGTPVATTQPGTTATTQATTITGRLPPTGVSDTRLAFAGFVLLVGGALIALISRRRPAD